MCDCTKLYSRDPGSTVKVQDDHESSVAKSDVEQDLESMSNWSEALTNLGSTERDSGEITDARIVGPSTEPAVAAPFRAAIDSRFTWIARMQAKLTGSRLRRRGGN
jgi:hypothetical protein